MNETLGKRIAQYRKEQSLTQENLAERLGISSQAVSKWENDLSCPDISILPQLAEALGVTTDELLGKVQRHGGQVLPVYRLGVNAGLGLEPIGPAVDAPEEAEGSPDG